MNHIQSRYSTNNEPRLRRQVVFVDWHGVLSETPFWHSIVDTPSHPYHVSFKDAATSIFGDQELTNKWMRGHITSSDVLAVVRPRIDKRAKEDYPLRRLIKDCHTMVLNESLVKVLKQVKRSYHLVIATDNMDCFVEAAVQRLDLRFFDDLISSSDVGVLKAESPSRFFGTWLSEHAMNFDNAILLDDGMDNCNQFEVMGGYAINVCNGNDAANRLAAWARLEYSEK